MYFFEKVAKYNSTYNYPEDSYETKTAGLASFGRKVVNNLKGRKEDLAKLDSIIATNKKRVAFGDIGFARSQQEINLLRQNSASIRAQYKPSSNIADNARNFIDRAKNLSSDEKDMQKHLDNLHRYNKIREKASTNVLRGELGRINVKSEVAKTRIKAGLLGAGAAGLAYYGGTN